MQRMCLLLLAPELYGTLTRPRGPNAHPARLPAVYKMLKSELTHA